MPAEPQFAFFLFIALFFALLIAMVGGPSKLYESSRAQVTGAIEALVKRAIKSGDIRKDLDAFDLLRALIGVSNVASAPDWQQSAKKTSRLRGQGWSARILASMPAV